MARSGTSTGNGTRPQAADSDRYRLMVEALPAAALLTDAQGYIEVFNDAAVTLWGRAPQRGVDRYCGCVRHYDAERKPLAHDAGPLALALRDGKPRVEELVLERPDGTQRHVLAHAQPVRDKEGTVTGAVNVLIDIQRTKQVENDLREADRQRSRFLPTLAHELRNPLAPIRSGLEVIRLANGDREVIEQARQMMERQLDQLIRLVDDLLDLSRVSRGAIDLRRTRVDLCEIVRSAVETSRPLIDESGHDLVLHLPTDRCPLYVDADPTRLSQVLSNLLNNAAKYTNAGGRIDVTVRRVGDTASLSVRDNGIGIPADMLDVVFEMFGQIDGSIEKSRGGLGIGLNIARRLVEMHGGTIEARSAGIGQGSEFVVLLPALAAGDSAPDARDEEEDSMEQPGERRRILVADDNADSAETLALLLEVAGHEVRTARDGLEVVDLAGAFRPHVILLDIGMPRMNGYEACRRIRDEQWGKEPLIVAITGWGYDEYKERSREAGFDYHVVKPVDPRALQELLARPIQRNTGEAP